MVPVKGFFKGTCLFAPIAPETPAPMEALVKQLQGRIAALRIHENEDPGKTANHIGRSSRSGHGVTGHAHDLAQCALAGPGDP
jgi:hypothetical protein